MRGLVVEAPYQARVIDVPDPAPREDQVVVDVLYAGLCGTDLELFSGQLPYFQDGTATFPIQIGHEWCGHVSDIGRGVDDSWLGAFVTGDTQLGCGRCKYCRRGRHNVCEARYEIGIRGGWPGALADRLLVPASSLHRLPPTVTPLSAAFAEPAGTAVRAVRVVPIGPAVKVCVWGPGTIGLLALQIASALGATVDVVGLRPEQLALAQQLGARATYLPAHAPSNDYQLVIDATGSPEVPSLTIDQVDAGGVVALVGVAESDALSDLRRVVLHDVSVVGILAGSAGLGLAIQLLSEGTLRGEPLIGEVISLDAVPEYLRSGGTSYASGAPKTLIDLRLR